MTSMTTTAGDRRRALWLKRLGLAGFYFFLIKGLAWLAAPLIFYWLVQ